MSVIINTNFSAISAANNLAQSNSMLQKSLNRLSSGSRIVNPSDDAGGLAVAMKLSAAATRSGAAATGIANTTSYLQTQDGALQTTASVLNRMSELQTMSLDPTKSSNDTANYDTEFKQLVSELTSLTSEKFNGVSLFGSSTFSVAVTEDGSTSTAVTLPSADLASSSSGIGTITTLASLTTAGLTLSTITAAIQNVATMRAANGAAQSRLGFASDLLTTNKANLQAAVSRIQDVDVAQESTQLARYNVLVQAGTAMLAQANQSSLSALKLLQ